MFCQKVFSQNIAPLSGERLGSSETVVGADAASLSFGVSTSQRIQNAPNRLGPCRNKSCRSGWPTTCRVQSFNEADGRLQLTGVDARPDRRDAAGAASDRRIDDFVDDADERSAIHGEAPALEVLEPDTVASSEIVRYLRDLYQ